MVGSILEVSSQLYTGRHPGRNKYLESTFTAFLGRQSKLVMWTASWRNVHTGMLLFNLVDSRTVTKEKRKVNAKKKKKGT